MIYRTLFLSFFISLFYATGNAQILQWEISIGSAASENTQAMDVDADGNVYITGVFFNELDFDPSSGTTVLNAANGGAYIAKYNSVGNLVFAKFITSSQTIDAKSIKVASNGNISIVGEFSGTADFDPSLATQNHTALGFSDGFIAQYDNTGNYIWANTFGVTNASQGTNFQDLAFDLGGNICVLGSFGNSIDFDPSGATLNLTAAGEADVVMASFTSAGTLNWAKRIGGNSYDYGTGIQIDNAGNILIVGSFEGNVDFDPSSGTANLNTSGNPQVFVAKYDNDGNYDWAIKIQNDDEIVEKDITSDSQGNVYVVGSFYGISDFDPSSATVDFTAASQDGFMAKYDANGNFVWANVLSGVFSEDCERIEVDASSNIIVTGRYDDVVDFDPSSSVSNLSILGNISENFIAKYNADGDYISAQAIRNFDGFDDITALKISADNHIYVAGQYREGLGLNFNTQTLTSQGSDDIFVAKYKNETVSITEPEANSFQLFPNPSANYITVNLVSPNTLSVYSAIGSLVYTCPISMSHYIDVSDWAAGLYLVKSGNYVVKFLRE